MHYSAKRGIEIIDSRIDGRTICNLIEIAYRPSVYPAVCVVGGSGSYTLEILETNCTDNFALRSLKAIHLLPREGAAIWMRGGVGKSGVLEHKSDNISETRKAYRNSPTLFRTVPSPTPYGLPFPRLRVRNSIPKLQSLLSQERVKLRTSNVAGTFKSPSEQRPIKNFVEKGVWAYPGTCSNFLSAPYYHRNG